MAEGFSEFQSSEERGEVAGVASVDKGKSDEELHVHLLPQQGSIATGGDNGTYIEQLQEHETLTSLNGGHEHERLVHTVYSTSNPASDDNNRHVIPRYYDELVEHVVPSHHHTCQEVIDAQQEKLQLESELGRRLFVEDKQKRNEKVYQSLGTHANEQIKSCSAGGASYDFTGIEGRPLGGAGLLQEPGASYMESMMNCIQADRIKPHTVDEVASWPDEHNRFSLPLFTRQDERGYAVGSSTFEESFNGTTGPDFTQNSDHLPSGSMGNMAHLAAAGRSNGVLNGVLSEAESTAVHPYAPGNASGTCSLLNPAGDQVAVVSEPCRAESANSRESMSDRNTVTDCNGINTALLVLAQRVQAICVASGERQIEEEQHREARMRTWNSNRRFQGQEDFITESLDSTPNSARAQARREAVIRASTEVMMRGLSSCYGPVEHSCVCQENDGRQACRVHGTIAPETCQPDLAHDECCRCLQHVFSGSLMLPCSHRVHRECLVSMIRNNELCCPICCFAFLQSG